MIKELAFTDIDGIFGPRTEEAVKSFQGGSGLTVDGIVGPRTWEALPADPNTPQLAKGASGPVVVALQEALRDFDPGPVDGLFGPRTEAAVRAYQRDQGVLVDGIVGDQTWWVPAGAAGATLASLAGLTTA
jgi:murein L,D-transpeptidase YcbB/YkuD